MRLSLGKNSGISEYDTEPGTFDGVFFRNCRNGKNIYRCSVRKEQ